MTAIERRDDPAPTTTAPTTTASATAFPRRIAALMSTRGISGPGRQLAGLAQGLASHGIELHILLLDRPGVGLAGFDRFLDDQGVSYRTFQDRGPLDLRLLRAIGRHLDDWQPDIVHSHDYKSAGLAYALRRLGRRTPWVGVFHGDTDLGLKDRLYNRLHTTLLGGADRIVVMSRRQLARFGRESGKAVVIHNAALPIPPIERQEPALARLLEFRARSPRPLLGVIGRLSHEKGLDLFLDALGKLAEDGTPCTAVIIGDGPLQNDLETHAARLGLSQRILFAGRIEAMHKVYPLLDLLVIPSRSEGLPNVLLEAIRANVPVVSTDVGAVPEVHALAPDAFLMLPSGDHAAIADAIRASLDESSRQPTRRDMARANLARSLSLDRRVERHLDLYALLLREPSREKSAMQSGT